MPLAFSEAQLEQIKTFAYQLPHHLCNPPRPNVI